MGPFEMLSISGSALTAERQRSEVIAANMATPRQPTPTAAVPLSARKSSSPRPTRPRFSCSMRAPVITPANTRARQPAVCG